MPRRIHPHRIALTSLSCHPRPRRDIDFLSLSPFTIFFASSYALRCRRVSPARRFHPRIAQLIPRSCQPARGTTTPRRQCVLSKLDTYRSTTPGFILSSTDLFPSLSLSFFSRRRREMKI